LQGTPRLALARRQATEPLQPGCNFLTQSHLSSQGQTVNKKWGGFVGLVALQQRVGESEQRIRLRLAMADLNCPGKASFVVFTRGRNII
jgi:hypothetical protein